MPPDQAWAIREQTIEAATVKWANNTALDLQSEISTIGDEKVQWVSDVTGAEATFVGQAAGEAATEIKTDARRGH